MMTCKQRLYRVYQRAGERLRRLEYKYGAIAAEHEDVRAFIRKHRLFYQRIARITFAQLHETDA